MQVIFIRSALISATAALLLAGCGGAEGQGGPSAPAQHAISTSGAGSVLPPPVEASTPRSKLSAGIGSAQVVAESDEHRLVNYALDPHARR